MPNLINKIAKDYSITNLLPVDNMTFHYVASGYQNGNHVILKIGLDSKKLAREALCLDAFTKNYAANILASDNNMILMECAISGSSFRNFFPSNEMKSTKILCNIIKELHKAVVPENHDFYHLKELFKGLDKNLAIPNNILNKAKYLREKLLSSTTKEVLLHGDLHHDNILKNGDNWLVIDPKGFIGDPAFELAAYLCNPMPELLQENNAKEIISNRIKLCSAELNIPESRISSWLFLKSVLCWAWSLEDNLNPLYWSMFLDKISV